MDKRIIFAVAGSGKTTHIVSSLSEESRALVITYTDNNHHHLRKKICDKFGLIPTNVTVMTYFTFLYSFCYKPFLHITWRAKGINWEIPPHFTLQLKRTNPKFFVDQNSRLYSNRIAKLIEVSGVVDDVKRRLEKYYDFFFVDEVQDFAGHDFNLLKALSSANINICFVGDFYQHTFDTSRDGNTNSTLHDDFSLYQKHFVDSGITIDTKTLSRSYRCAPEICTFIREKLHIYIESHKEISSKFHHLAEEKQIVEFFYDEEVVKLFFKEHYKYQCHSNNWGKSKGLDDYGNVCISLYPAAFNAFKSGDFSALPASSINKLYVACTRANRSVFFVEEAKLRSFKSK
jgi:superfamily I DNA/RNA helicase